jgi:hypothetical protein
MKDRRYLPFAQSLAPGDQPNNSQSRDVLCAGGLRQLGARCIIVRHDLLRRVRLALTASIQ